MAGHIPCLDGKVTYIEAGVFTVHLRIFIVCYRNWWNANAQILLKSRMTSRNRRLEKCVDYSP
jgi:hypothetical protein